MKKVLFFFPHNPYPPKNGAHKRCIELLRGLKESGCSVVFASSTFTTRDPWSETAIEALDREFGCTVRLHLPGTFELDVTRCFNRGRWLPFKAIRKIILQDEGIRPSLISIGMRRWFNGMVDAFQPDVIFMNYAYFDCIVSRESRKGRTSIMEMHDLVTLNEMMQAAVRDVVGLEGMASGNIPESALDPEFFLKINLCADPAEFLIYDKYDYTLCISERERDLVQQNSPNTRAVYLPMTQSVSNGVKTYDGDALFTLGPNTFNLQGYYFFLDKVLPLVLSQQSGFRLDVTGNFFFNFSPRTTRGIQYRGFVSDLRSYYESSGFFICPVFGGTGQQVKVIEAMAHGLPVVALDNIAGNSPVRHGVNGLIARNEEEFAHHVLQLWNDRKLCRRLGEEARKTVVAEFNPERVVNGLASLVV